MTSPLYVTRGTCAICNQRVYLFDGVSPENQSQIAEAAGLASIRHVMTEHGAPRVDAIVVEWADEPAEMTAQRETDRVQAAVDLRDRLAAWSLAHHDVAWWPRVSETLWRMATVGAVVRSETESLDVDDGKEETPIDEIDAIYRLGQKAGGWWVLIPAFDEPSFLDMTVWERLYEAYALQAAEHASGGAAGGLVAAPPNGAAS